MGKSNSLDRTEYAQDEPLKQRAPRPGASNVPGTDLNEESQVGPSSADPDLLAQLDGSSRTEMLLGAQRQHGNHYVQRLVANATSPEKDNPEDNLAKRIQAATAGGRAIDTDVRGRLEDHLGAGLDAARLHTDSEADSLAREVDAVAFTTGSHIFFRADAYHPETDAGVATLSHEAAHTLQQANGAAVSDQPADSVHISSPSDPLELAAGRASASVIAADVSAHQASGAVTASGADGGLQVQRIAAGAVLGVASAALGGIQFLQSQGDSRHGLTYSSEMVTYPKDTARLDGLENKTVEVAHFISDGLSPLDTMFELHGDFTPSNDGAAAANPAMANVYITLGYNKESYFASSLNFKALAMPTAIGSATDPRLRFMIEGTFDPVGPGECSYSAVLEVDRFGTVTTVSKRLTYDSERPPAQLSDGVSGGFEIRIPSVLQPAWSAAVDELENI